MSSADPTMGRDLTALPDTTARGAALPSRLARALAFVAILAAGACGGLIGYAVTDLQVDGEGGTAAGIGGIVGGLVAAGGVAVVAVLALRAMTEWKAIEQRQQGPGRG